MLVNVLFLTTIAVLAITLFLVWNHYDNALREANRIYIVNRENARRAGFNEGYKQGRKAGEREEIRKSLPTIMSKEK